MKHALLNWRNKTEPLESNQRDEETDASIGDAVWVSWIIVYPILQIFFGFVLIRYVYL